MKNCPYCDKSFETWKSVRAHTSNCKICHGGYFIDEVEGPIHYSIVADISLEELRNKFPNLKAIPSSILKAFRKRGYDIGTFRKFYSDDELLNILQNFSKQYGRTPSKYSIKKPDFTLYLRRWGSWNNAVKAAGLIPNNQNGYGVPTIGKDGHIYRSIAEAEFADTNLYGKYKYIIEPHYPEPHEDWMYDWYIPELNLYIELNGGLRPERIQEKIKFNEELGRNMIVI